MAKSYEMDMCNGPILRKVLTYSIPLMLSGVLQLLFNAADVIVVGRFAGSQSLARVGSTSSLINLLINVFIGLSIGANVLVARYYGAKNDRDMSETIHTAITVSLMSGLFLVFLGLFTSRFWLELMGTPDDVIDKSTIYMRIYFAGMPATMVYNFGSAILRAIGDTKRPLYFLTVAGFLTVFFGRCYQCGTEISGYPLPDAFRWRDLLGVNRRKLLLIIKVGLPAGIQGAILRSGNVLYFRFSRAFRSIPSEVRSLDGEDLQTDSVVCQFLRFDRDGRQHGIAEYRGICVYLDECAVSDQFKLYEPEYRSGEIYADQKDSCHLPRRRCDSRTGAWICSIPRRSVAVADIFRRRRRYFLWTAPDVDHLYDVFPVRRDGYDGRKHPRTWVFDPADACLSDRRLRTASDLDLYHICSAAIAGDPVSVVPDLLGGHSDGTYDLLLAGGEEDAEGRYHPGTGIEFEKHKQNVIKNNSFDNLISVKKKYLTPIRLSCMITQVMRNGKNC